jgi:hypothetical protein
LSNFRFTLLHLLTAGYGTTSGYLAEGLSPEVIVPDVGVHSHWNEAELLEAFDALGYDEQTMMRTMQKHGRIILKDDMGKFYVVSTSN